MFIGKLNVYLNRPILNTHKKRFGMSTSKPVLVGDDFTASNPSTAIENFFNYHYRLFSLVNDAYLEQIKKSHEQPDTDPVESVKAIYNRIHQSVHDWKSPNEGLNDSNMDLEDSLFVDAVKHTLNNGTAIISSMVRLAARGNLKPQSATIILDELGKALVTRFPEMEHYKQLLSNRSAPCLDPMTEVDLEVQSLNKAMATKNLSFNVEGLDNLRQSKIALSKLQFYLIIQLLFENAQKYSPPQPSPNHIYVDFKKILTPVGPRLRMTVSNPGKTLDLSILGLIGSQVGYRGDQAGVTNGTGKGVCIVNRILQNKDCPSVRYSHRNDGQAGTMATVDFPI